MRAEVVALGDELTSGARLDTNSQWISQQLEQWGIPVVCHTTVGDQLEMIVEAFRAAISRADIVVVTGGLGPTADDLTREALAQATGRMLVRDPAALAHIRELFAKRGRAMPERNVVQADFPQGSRVIPNPHGTAPGILLEVPRPTRAACVVLALPGVPAELKQMWVASVAAELTRLTGPDRNVISHRSICCFGAGESDIEQRLPDLIRRGRIPSVGITASQATITLRVTACGPSLPACQTLMEPTVQTIYDCLGDLVFGEGDDTLQDAAARLLWRQGVSVAVAEWATQGLVSRWLTEASAGTDCCRGGIVVTSPESLCRVLGVETTTPSSASCDAGQVVSQMAVAVRDRFGADFGLAVGPRPQLATQEQSSAHLRLALATPTSTMTESHVFAAHPSIQVPRSAKQALNLLRLSLLARELPAHGS